jgi:hypothetical protein
MVSVRTLLTGKTTGSETCLNLRYLGDAFDHWKGSLFESLQQAAVLRDLAVDPLDTDPEDWEEADRALFARLLRIEQSNVVSHQQSLIAHREIYFQEITHQGDLFMDPDTGIATSRGANASHYLRPAELHDLLDSQPDRVVAVYQHISHQRTRERISTVLSVLSSTNRHFACCSYESGTVAMLFLSQNLARASSIDLHFREFLGGQAERRIYLWPSVDGETHKALDRVE